MGPERPPTDKPVEPGDPPEPVEPPLSSDILLLGQAHAAHINCQCGNMTEKIVFFPDEEGAQNEPVISTKDAFDDMNFLEGVNEDDKRPCYNTSKTSWKHFLENGAPMLREPVPLSIDPNSKAATPGFEGNDRLKNYDESLKLLKGAAFDDMEEVTKDVTSAGGPSTQVDDPPSTQDGDAWSFAIEYFAMYLFAPPKDRKLNDIFGIIPKPKDDIGQAAELIYKKYLDSLDREYKSRDKKKTALESKPGVGGTLSWLCNQTKVKGTIKAKIEGNVEEETVTKG